MGSTGKKKTRHSVSLTDLPDMSDLEAITDPEEYEARGIARALESVPRSGGPKPSGAAKPPSKRKKDVPGDTGVKGERAYPQGECRLGAEPGPGEHRLDGTEDRTPYGDGGAAARLRGGKVQITVLGREELHTTLPDVPAAWTFIHRFFDDRHGLGDSLESGTDEGGRWMTLRDEFGQVQFRARITELEPEMPRGSQSPVDVGEEWISCPFDYRRNYLREQDRAVHCFYCGMVLQRKKKGRTAGRRGPRG